MASFQVSEKRHNSLAHHPLLTRATESLVPWDCSDVPVNNSVFLITLLLFGRMKSSDVIINKTFDTSYLSN